MPQTITTISQLSVPLLYVTGCFMALFSFTTGIVFKYWNSRLSNIIITVTNLQEQGQGAVTRLEIKIDDNREKIEEQCDEISDLKVVTRETAVRLDNIKEQHDKNHK